MPEPVLSPSAAVLAASPPAVAMLTAFGVQLGLRTDVLVAGFAGALVAIVLLGSVPSEGDTWRHLVRTTGRRVGVALASSLTAGYLTPLFLLIMNMPDPMFLATAFTLGAGAQKILRGLIDRWEKGAGQSEGAKP
jgi:hypothetical protein